MQYRKETFAFLKTIRDNFPIDENAQFEVDMEFICYKPKKPSNPYPRFDIDNLVKSPLDSITYTGMVWHDDIQIITIHATKRYQEKGEDYGTKIRIKKV